MFLGLIQFSSWLWHMATLGHITDEEPSAQTGEVTYFVIVLLGRIENLLYQPGLGVTMLGSEI